MPRVFPVGPADQRYYLIRRDAVFSRISLFDCLSFWGSVSTAAFEDRERKEISARSALDA